MNRDRTSMRGQVRVDPLIHFATLPRIIQQTRDRGVFLVSGFRQSYCL